MVVLLLLAQRSSQCLNLEETFVHRLTQIFSAYKRRLHLLKIWGELDWPIYCLICGNLCNLWIASMFFKFLHDKLLPAADRQSFIQALEFHHPV